MRFCNQEGKKQMTALNWNVQTAIRTKIVKVYSITLDDARKLQAAGFVVIIVR
jgi:hypothetical protein